MIISKSTQKHKPGERNSSHTDVYAAPRKHSIPRNFQRAQASHASSNVSSKKNVILNERTKESVDKNIQQIKYLFDLLEMM